MWNTEWTNFIHTRYVIPVFFSERRHIANVNVKSRSRSRFCLKMASFVGLLPVLAAWHTFCCLFVIALTNKDWLIDCSLYVVVRPSAVCDVCAPYSIDWNFRQCFYAIWSQWYLSHPLTSRENFMEIVIRPKGTPRLRVWAKRKRGSQSDFGLIEGYIW